eukprot:scaffold2353_cov167-Amphora_coffeaeformis.AAC.14
MSVSRFPLKLVAFSMVGTKSGKKGDRAFGKGPTRYALEVQSREAPDGKKPERELPRPKRFLFIPLLFIHLLNRTNNNNNNDLRTSRSTLQLTPCREETTQTFRGETMRSISRGRVALASLVPGLLLFGRTNLVSSETPPGAALLPVGDINILVVTDTHSWVGGHGDKEAPLDADYGDVVSFFRQLQQSPSFVNRDLFFVMNGDWIDGTGLALDGDPSYLVPILEKMPWDAVNVGNHELYSKVSFSGGGLTCRKDRCDSTTMLREAFVLRAPVSIKASFPNRLRLTIFLVLQGCWIGGT